MTKPSSQMRVLYLYAELMGYQVPVLREYVDNYNAHVHVVHWGHKKLTPYIPPQLDHVTYYDRAQYTSHDLMKLARDIDPNIVYICAWQDKGYLPVARMLRKRNIPVVAGFDGQWKDSVKQRIASLIGPCILRRYFSHAWVAGPYQYEYATRLGFKKHQIVFNLLSGNTALFNRGAEYLGEKKTEFPHRFLYVGNFRSVKGTDILLDAYKRYRTQYNGDWELICVGNGDLKYLLENVPGIEVVDFASQDRLVQIRKKAGVFILPSRFDQWGVVVHEFASAGMPLILSENVGASPVFLVDGFNGAKFRHNSSQNLARAMHHMSSKTDVELIEMGKNSYLLSKKIDPHIVAATFFSIIDK